MELEELKVSWKTLNERLERYEFINKQLMKETICNKGTTAIEKLQNIELSGMILCAALTLFLLCILLFKPTTLPIKINIVVMGIMAITYSIWTYTKYRFLNGIDVSNMDILSIKKKINTYKSRTYKEHIIAYISFIPVIGVYYQKKGAFTSNQLIAIIIITVLSCIILEILTLILYRKQLKQINKTLSELKEFEEK